MNRQQAKELSDFLTGTTALQREVLQCSGMHPHVIKNWEAGNTRSFAEGAIIKYLGERIDSPSFDGLPSCYTVQEPEIDWEKAMKHKAWDQKFMFKDRSDVDWFGPCELRGYEPDDNNRHPFRAGGTNWGQCKPVEGFEIPKEWLKDDEN